MAVAVVVLLLLVLFLCGSAIDFRHRWRNEKMWSEHLGRLLDKTRVELAREKRLGMVKGRSDYGTTND